LLDRAEYDRFRVSPTDPATLRARDVERLLKKLADASAGRLKVEKFAESNEGRPIYLATLGAGQRRVLLWSQMHGDEPTHTAVLLDLFSYLLQQPAKPQAAEILGECTLMFIPMLNPDGAEAVMRFNAQGIDINRDWRRLATPEGRALVRAAKTLKPQFGFNLHNQNPRTTSGRPPRPAAVSVLAPAPDATRKESPSWRTAKQMCTCFVEAVRPYAEGMISRYDDAHEPRAFGDGIQSLGVATMLVEAGGWTDADPEPMTRLHFHGMLATLHAIATDKYRTADHQIYEDLPNSNSVRMNDCLITKANVLDAKVAEPFVADIVIDQTPSERLTVTSNRDGKIVDIGDLPSVSARYTLNASDSLILPGRIAFLEDWAPRVNLTSERIEKLLAGGVTTVIGFADLSNMGDIDSINAAREMPINWGFVGHIDKAFPLSTDAERLDRIAWAATLGLLAIANDRANEAFWHQLDHFGLSLLQLSQLRTESAMSGKYRELSQQTAKSCKLLNMHGKRGRVVRDASADLVMFDVHGKVDAKAAVDWRRLARVMVAGEIVWENGKRSGGTPGIFLRRS
jgi:hypothetical protein